jgi:hypothetical protein
MRDANQGLQLYGILNDIEGQMKPLHEELERTNLAR